MLRLALARTFRRLTGAAHPACFFGSPCGTARRSASTAGDSSDLAAFNRLAESSILGFQEQVERAAESAPDAKDVDVDYADSVLKIRVAGVGTFVLNKQPPNRELWYSSPISGPAHYVFDAQRGGWYCRRDGHLLLDVLQREMTDALGVPVSLRVVVPDGSS